MRVSPSKILAFSLLLALGFASASPSAAQVTVRPTLDVLRIWGGSYGWGLPVGLRVRDDEREFISRLDVYPAQHRGRYRLRTELGDVREPGWYGNLLLQHEVTRRRPFFGLGADAPEDGRVLTRVVRQETWLRVGRNVLRGVGVHGYGGLRHLNRPRIVDEEENPEDMLLPRDQAVLDDTRGVTGITAGLRLIRDTRDANERPTRGYFVDAQVEEFVGVGGTDDRYGRLAVSAYGYLPLGRDATLAMRTIAVTTRPNSKGDLSYLLLPQLSNHYIAGTSRQRFVDNDVLALTVEARSPSYLVPMLPFDLQFTAQASLAQVYNAIEDQFTFRVGSDVGSEGDRLPLRAFGGIGARLYHAGEDNLFVAGYLGTGTVTLSIGTVNFENDSRRLRELWR